MVVLNHPAVAPMVAAAIGEESLGEDVSLGYVSNNKLKGGIVFNGYTGLNVVVNFAGAGKWLAPELVKACADLVYNKLGCVRATALIAESNKKAIKLAKHAGFKEEGKLRKGAGDEDQIVLGMLREECRWLD